MQPTPQDNQLMSKRRVLGFKPQLRLERRGQDGQNETEQPDHSASLGDSITSSARIRFSVHTSDARHARTKPIKGCSELKSWAMRIAQRAGTNKAKVALARKLAIMLRML